MRAAPRRGDPLRDKHGIAHTLAAQTALAIVTERGEHAVQLAGATDSHLRALGVVLDTLERGLFDAVVTAAQAQLDTATFDALWAEGQAMTLEQAVAYALGEGGESESAGSNRIAPATQ